MMSSMVSRLRVRVMPRRRALLDDAQDISDRLLVHSEGFPDRLQRHAEAPHPPNLPPNPLVGERLVGEDRELQRHLGRGSNWLQARPPRASQEILRSSADAHGTGTEVCSPRRRRTVDG